MKEVIKAVIVGVEKGGPIGGLRIKKSHKPMNYKGIILYFGGEGGIRTHG